MIRFIVPMIVVCFCTGQLVAALDEEEEVSTHMPELLSKPILIEATAGEDVSLPCEVDDLGSFVKLWKKGRTDVLFVAEIRIFRDERFQVLQDSLKIKSIKPQDSGEYICQISTNPQLEVIHKLNVLYPPTVKPNPEDGYVTVREGESVTLSCETTGNPEPSVSWKHAGRNYDISEGNTFSIVSASKSASGEYECIADNGVGNASSAVITVEVVSAPKVYPKPKDGVLVVKEGDPIEVSCEATGDPMPVISWKTPGGEKAHKSREGNRIVITEAERIHAGAYECIANNSLGVFTSAIIRVNVLYPPEVKVQNSWIHAGEGTTVNMSCNVKGEPMPSVTWKKGEAGKPIHSSDHYHVKGTSHHHVLQIRHLKEDDFGRYECVASNSLGSVADNIHIIGTPQVPAFTSKPHGSSGQVYTLEWMVKSPSPVLEYSLIYRKKSDNEDWMTVTIPSSQETSPMKTHKYELNALQPGTSYEAMVTARNKFGWSKQSDPFVFTTKSPEAGDVDSMVEVTELPGNGEITNSNEKRSEAMSNRSSHSQGSWHIALVQASFLLILMFFH